jgi:hypothetical protein
MSDFRAIAAVSASLRTLLRDRMELPMGMATVPPISIGTPVVPPPQSPEALEPEAARINLFLYQVTESPFLKNRDLPARASSMAYGKPPLSLELHFLLTTYGSQVNGEISIDETVAQFLLGSAMRVLHDYPVITPQLQTVREPYGQQILHESLLKASEQVKLCLNPMNIDDLTKIWTALTQPYRLSVAYSVSLVQIESQASRNYPRLVGDRPEGGPSIIAVPLDRPAIETLSVIRLGETIERTAPYARVNDTLVITGRNFGRVTEVEINGLPISVSPQSTTRIEVTIPDTSINGMTIPLDQRLQPGAQAVEVLSQIENLATFKLRSNRANFTLVPLISAINTTAPRTLTIIGERLYQADSSMQSLVGYTLFEGDAYNSASPQQIQITLPDVLPQSTASVYLGDPITNLPTIDATPELSVTIDGNGPHTLTFSFQPDTLEEAAIELENRLRSVNSEAQLFKGLRVTLLDNQLVIVAGGALGTVNIQAIAGNNAATVLGLSGGTNRPAYLSGMISPVPRLSNSAPELRILMANRTFDTAIAAFGANIWQLADALEAAIVAGPTAAFHTSKVTVLGDQLLILTGNNRPIVFDVNPNDDTTVSELHLRRDYPVRVRVNGAESIGGVNTVELPL